MNTQRRSLHELHRELSRRDLLRLAGVGLSGLGLAAIVGCGSGDGNASATSTPGIVVDPPPETTTIRLLADIHYVSRATMILAEQFLPAEGFTDVQYVYLTQDIIDRTKPIAAGEVDIGLPIASSVTVAADANDQLVVLAGVYNSSFELFGNDGVQSLRDLKGKRIWVANRSATDGSYTLMAALLTYVGIDVDHEVEFVELSFADQVPKFLEGAIDVFYGTRPYSTPLRNANIGHVILDGAKDPPWSQYFGGLVTANRAFIEQHPAATKRALRAIMKVADLSAKEPERAARYLVDNSLTFGAYESALDAITGVSYAAWREFNPEDTMRFYALRLKDAGLVESTPDELIARATDWRYLDEIKRELAV